MRWSCMCGRTFHRSNMCLRCNDRLPILVKEGEITWERRSRMSNEQYKSFLRDLEATNQRKVDAAVSDLRKMLAQGVDHG